MGICIALAGNPNCGKTTMFNDLTGAQSIRWQLAGRHRQKKEGKYTRDKDVTITDLPGIYSLSPYSPEEIVARDYLLEGGPDAVINLVDATNLERNLYLTSQILIWACRVVIALNMMDLVEKNGDKIDVARPVPRAGLPHRPHLGAEGPRHGGCCQGRHRCSSKQEGPRVADEVRRCRRGGARQDRGRPRR